MANLPAHLKYDRIYTEVMSCEGGPMDDGWDDFARLVGLIPFLDCEARIPLAGRRLNGAMKSMPGAEGAAAFMRRSRFVFVYTFDGAEYAVVPAFAALQRDWRLRRAIESALPCPPANNHTDPMLQRALSMINAPGKWYEPVGSRPSNPTTDLDGNDPSSPPAPSIPPKKSPKSGTNSGGKRPGSDEVRPESGANDGDSGAKTAPPSHVHTRAIAQAPAGTRANLIQSNPTLSALKAERECMNADPVPAPTPPGPEGPGSAREVPGKTEPPPKPPPKLITRHDRLGRPYTLTQDQADEDDRVRAEMAAPDALAVVKAALDAKGVEYGQSPDERAAEIKRIADEERAWLAEQEAAEAPTDAFAPDEEVEPDWEAVAAMATTHGGGDEPT
jgi:hypothetical protein